MNPMYLVNKPPKMLPTTTLRSMPTETAKSKRQYAENTEMPFNIKNAIKGDKLLNPDYWWWLGVIMTFIGGVVLFYS